MYDEQTNSIEPVAHAGVDGEYTQQLHLALTDEERSKGPTITAFREGTRVVVDDIEHDQRMSAWRSEALKHGYRAAVVFPLKVDETSIGTFNLYAGEPFYFNEEELRLLDEMARDISFSLKVISDEELRLKQEEQLRQQASLLDLSPDAILVQDLDTHILYWNKGAEKMFGWTAEEVKMRSVKEVLFSGQEELFEKIQETVLRQGSWTGELRHRNKEGKELITDTKRVLITGDHGEPVGMLVIKRDITEKKMLEAQYLRAQRLESIGTLASGVAHDLNNVLTPVMLAIEYMMRKTSDEQLKKMLETVEATVKRGADLVKQGLSFARGVEAERKPIQLRHIVDEVVNVIKETFPRSISIKTQIPKDLPLVLADPTQLHQVFMNLCVNARDAMPCGGMLEIRAETVIVDEQYARMHIEAKPGKYVVIVVTDTGTGMSPEVADRIFEPFFTTKELNKGTGLGLSTVLSIVKSHEGFINVYSEPGMGTTFRIYLPAYIGSEKVAVEEEEFNLTGRGELILLVDDEKAILEITRVTLESNGYSVITAGDGTEAVAIYVQRRDEISVVVTDMMMPFMDGPSTIRALKKINPEVKIIAVSGLKASEEKGVLPSDVKFLMKPYTAQRLLQVLYELIHSGV
ncbi:MAG: hybrid sensor histidine kinase/response regulator [Candidatus Kryptoniota bacterium]